MYGKNIGFVLVTLMLVAAISCIMATPFVSANRTSNPTCPPTSPQVGTNNNAGCTSPTPQPGTSNNVNTPPPPQPGSNP